MGCLIDKQVEEVIGHNNDPSQDHVIKAVVNPEQIDIQSRDLPDVPGPNIPSSLSSKVAYRALFDFQGLSNDDLDFQKGDRLSVERDSQNNDWWIATNQRTGKQGYIPSNFVCKDDDTPQNQDCWFDIDRREAERKLLLPGIKLGTFLVRESTDKASQVLSVRESDAVRHYRIIHKNGRCYIAETKQFLGIRDLLHHYKNHKGGLCARLSEVCPRQRPIPTFTDMEVKRSAITTSTLLGKGHFGEVRKGKLYGTFDVAVKYLKPGMMSTAAFLDEAHALHKLRHRKLVELIAVCSTEEPILIVTELMELGSLLDYLREDEGRTVTFTIVLDMAAQIAEGMAFLETRKYIHRDLRAANILVDKSLTVKIADLGLARTVEKENSNGDKDRSQFPLKWTSPEAANRKQFSIKSDVWSFGVLLYELVTLGKTPYPGMTGSEVLVRIDNGYRMPMPISDISFPATYYDVMKRCWDADPSRRPSFSDLYKVLDNFDKKQTEEDYD